MEFRCQTDVKQHRQRGRKGKGVVFTMTPLARSGFNSHPGYVVASLNEALYDDYLCLVASNKQQFTWEEVKRQPENLENGELLSR